MKIDPRKRKANNDYNLGEPETDEEPGEMMGPSMEDRIQVILDQCKNWDVSRKIIKSDRVFIELTQNQFTISYRWSMRSSNCGLYEDGVENKFGNVERVQHRLQFSEDVSIEESLWANLNECMILVLHAL